MMKTLLVVLTAAGLTGCAVYPAPAYDPYGGGVVTAPPVVVQQPPVYIQGGVYRSYPAPVYPRAYGGVPPRPFVHGPRPGHRGNGDRDRDHDGVPDRVDRDRDGDGVPNRYDRRPGNPNLR